MASGSDRNTDARGKPGTERTEKNFLPLQPIKTIEYSGTLPQQ